MSSSANTPDGLDAPEKLVTLLREACEICSKQYEDFYKSFIGLDSKAQSTVTASGVVLGAVVAFVNAKTVAPLLSRPCGFGRLVIFSPAVCSVIAASLSVLATRVVGVTIPFWAKGQIDEVQDLSRLPATELTNSYIADFYQSRLRHWESALNDIEQKVERKAGFVVWGQIILIAGFTFLLILFFYSVTGG